MQGRIFGIDLGTTNSLIGYKDKLFGDMVPSIADVQRGAAGESLRGDFETSRSFKVNMSCGLEGKEAIAASALVLKALVSQAEQELPNIEVKKVVIAVPAFFTDNQRQATIRAGRLAGLDVVALINEPTAAAMYYSHTARKLSVVFDLGGGTFDVSVIDSRLGLFDVQSTDGIILGGNDLDAAIRSNVLKKASFRIHKMGKADMERLKAMCEEAKISIQKTKTDYKFDLRVFDDITDSKSYTLSVDTYVSLMKLTFKRAIVETKKVIEQAIMYGDVFDFLLVGGSTRCPFLQDWIKEEIGVTPVPLSYNPDTIVALGACLYASLIESGEAETKVSDVTKALGIGLFDGTVRCIIPKDSKLPIQDSLMVTNPVESSALNIKLYQGESLLAANNEYIGELEFEFSELKEANKANVKVTVHVDTGGIISFKAKEIGDFSRPEMEITLKRNME